MIKILTTILSTCLLACLPTLATISAAERETIIIGAENSWPPFSDKNGKGISYNLVAAALAKVGQEFSIEVFPYARALLSTEKGYVDACWNVTRQPSTETIFHFGAEPLLYAKASYFFPKGQKLNFTDPSNIPNGLNIGVINDYEYGHEYSSNKHRFNEVPVDSQEQIINMLLANRIDVAIMFDEVASYHLQQMGLAEDAITKGAINHISDIYVAFSKQNPEHRKLATKLDQGLRLIKDSGEYNRIFQPHE